MMLTTLINHWYDYADGKAYFVLVLVFIGLYGLIKTISKLPKLAAMKHWPTASGKITRSDVINSPRTGKRREQTYINDITYHYQVDGVSFESKRIFYGSVDSRADKAHHDALASGKYKVGADVPVFYNPKNPKDSLLEPDAAVSVQLFYILLIGIWFTVMTAALMKYIKLF